MSTAFFVCICDSSGTPLVFKKVSELSPLLIKTSLSDMVKSITPEKQNSLFENETVRIIYQPIGSYYLALATTKTSNIIVDMECLKLITDIYFEYCEDNSERCILNAAFDLIFAFDEIFACGVPQSLRIDQLKSILKMESLEEEAFEALARIKAQEVKESAKLKAKQLDLQRKSGSRHGAKGADLGEQYNVTPKYFGESHPSQMSVRTTVQKSSSGMKLGQKDI